MYILQKITKRYYAQIIHNHIYIRQQQSLYVKFAMLQLLLLHGLWLLTQNAKWNVIYMSVSELVKAWSVKLSLTRQVSHLGYTNSRVYNYTRIHLYTQYKSNTENVLSRTVFQTTFRMIITQHHIEIITQLQC